MLAIKGGVQKPAFATALQVHLWLWSQLADKLFVPHGDFLFYFIFSWILVSGIKFVSGLLDLVVCPYLCITPLDPTYPVWPRQNTYLHPSPSMKIVFPTLGQQELKLSRLGTPKHMSSCLHLMALSLTLGS